MHTRQRDVSVTWLYGYILSCPLKAVKSLMSTSFRRSRMPSFCRWRSEEEGRRWTVWCKGADQPSSDTYSNVWPLVTARRS